MGALDAVAAEARQVVSRKRQLRGFFDFAKKPSSSFVDLPTLIAKAQICTVTGTDKRTGRAKESCRPLTRRFRAPKKGQRIVSVCPTAGSCVDYVIGGRS